MYLRKYDSSDIEQLAKLFYETVHTVNAIDYTKEQLDAWADGNVDLKTWDQSFLNHTTVVAIENEIIVGFGDMDSSGYLDRLYVHKDYQRRRIASAICDYLELNIKSDKFVTDASITAKPFFEKRGYQVIKKQEVVRHGITLINYVMEKQVKRQGEDNHVE